jgi:hypothetical protein
MTIGELVSNFIALLALVVGGTGLGWFFKYKADNEKALSEAAEKKASANKLKVDAEIEEDEAERKAKMALNSSYEIRLKSTNERLDILEKDNISLRQQIGNVLDENNQFRKQNYALELLLQRLLDVVYDMLKENQNISTEVKCRIETIKTEFNNIKFVK